MKTIKIRFIRIDGLYKVQYKNWFGFWCDWTRVMPFYNEIITHKEKEILLQYLLECHYKRDKRFTKVIEYPTIYIY